MSAPGDDFAQLGERLLGSPSAGELFANAFAQARAITQQREAQDNEQQFRQQQFQAQQQQLKQQAARDQAQQQFDNTQKMFGTYRALGDNPDAQQAYVQTFQGKLPPPLYDALQSGVTQSRRQNAWDTVERLKEHGLIAGLGPAPQAQVDVPTPQMGAMPPPAIRTQVPDPTMSTMGQGEGQFYVGGRMTPAKQGLHSYMRQNADGSYDRVEENDEGQTINVIPGVRNAKPPAGFERTQATWGKKLEATNAALQSVQGLTGAIDSDPSMTGHWKLGWRTQSESDATAKIAATSLALRGALGGTTKDVSAMLPTPQDSKESARKKMQAIQTALQTQAQKLQSMMAVPNPGQQSTGGPMPPPMPAQPQGQRIGKYTVQPVE